MLSDDSLSHSPGVAMNFTLHHMYNITYYTYRNRHELVTLGEKAKTKPSHFDDAKSLVQSVSTHTKEFTTET